jgi:nucleoside-diphosphate-sugar epimerase
LKKTGLSYTTVVNGCFLDYWCTKAFKSYMTPVTTFIDIANEFAAIPGTGDTPVAFTHTADVARYVVALLQKESWDPISYVVGDRVTMNQFLRLAEAAKGKCLSCKEAGRMTSI